MEPLRQWLVSQGLGEGWATTAAVVLWIAGAVVAVELMTLAGHALSTLLRDRRRKWAEAFDRQGAFRWALWVVVLVLAKARVVPVLTPWVGLADGTSTLLDSVLVVAITVLLSRVVRGVISVFVVRETTGRRLPLRALQQSVELILWTVGGIVLLAVVTRQQVTSVLTGLTALGAVLAFVFRDALLGWTAGVQIAANDLVRVGDWVTIPSHHADGFVTEIALTVVKVSNWDETISSVPTYAVVSEGFRNWRGMFEAGGRRIKRTLLVDATSVRPCDDALRERLAGLGVTVPDATAQRLDPVSAHATGAEGAPSVVPDMTNLAVFRRWLEARIAAHPGIRSDLLHMVRELEPVGRGVPVEIYAFTEATAWVAHEHLQADVLDDALAALPSFDLRVFQEPSGQDVRALTGR